MADPNLSALFPGHALGPAAKTMPLQLLNAGRASAGLVTKPSESRPSSTREGF